MDTLELSAREQTPREASHSAVSWAAITAGAMTALAIGLLLVTLGSGLGLASISPWAISGASATAFGISTGIGLIVVHWIASAAGGFITGRLRTKWTGVHTHEVFFRDTAHGLLTWALATLVGASLLASGASALIGGGVRAAATVAGGAAHAVSQAGLDAVGGASGGGASGYDIDRLFRTDRANAAANPQTAVAEAGRILGAGLARGDVPAADRAYLAALIAARTGLSQPDAETRVDDVIAREQAAAAKAKAAADAARKATSVLAIFTALAMLIGAFVASVAAAYGGNLRDEY